MIFSDRAIQIVAENKIQHALKTGELAHLPGFGKPLALLDEPYDANWWVRRKLKREGLARSALLAGSRVATDW